MKKSLLIFIFSWGLASGALAKCKPVYSGNPGGDSNGGVALNFGNIKLSPEEYQPVGLLGVTHATVGDASAFSKGANTLLYECDISDRGQLYEAFSTNGDSAVGGYNEYPAGSGIYQTFFPFIGIKITRDRDGKVFSRKWQRSPIDGTIENGKLHVYARDFSGITTELYRNDQTIRTHATNGFGCSEPAIDTYKGSYTCTQPNAYTVFVGPGWNADRNYVEGQDSATGKGYAGFSYYNWIGIGMIYAKPSLTQSLFGCKVQDYTKVVLMPTVSVTDVENNNRVGAPFTVKYRCGNFGGTRLIDSLAGVGEGKISVAFMAKNSHKEWAGATYVPFLLSDNDGQEGYARNVGIAITPFDRNTNLGFIQENSLGDYKGWFSLLEGEQQRVQVNSTRMEITSQFRAYYVPIAPGVLPVTPGKFDATAYILVRYQ